MYTTDSLHPAVVEVVVEPSARVHLHHHPELVDNVFDLMSRRQVEADGHMEWIDGNIGSRLTMKYPAVVIAGPKASGEVLSMAYAARPAPGRRGQDDPRRPGDHLEDRVQVDLQGRRAHVVPGLVRVETTPTAARATSAVRRLILDDESTSDTYPYMEIGARTLSSATRPPLRGGRRAAFYLSPGLTQDQGMGMIVNGFIEPVTRTLPMEYAVEWSRLIELPMEAPSADRAVPA